MELINSYSLGKKFFKNNIAMLFSKIIPPLFSFALSVFIARYLGTSGLGSFTFIISFYSIFCSFSLLGLNSLVIREVAYRKESINKILVNVSTIGFFSTCFMIIIMYVIITLTKYSYDIKISIYLMGLSILPFFILQIFESVFIANEMVKYITLIILTTTIIRTILSIILLILGYKIISLILLIVIFNIFSIILYIKVYIRENGKPFFKIDINYCKKILCMAPTFLSINLLGSFLNLTPTLILSKMRNIEEIGLYSAAYKLIFLWSIISSGFVVTVMPIFSKYFIISKEKFNEISKKFISYTMIIIPIFIIVLIITAKMLILLFFGYKFKDSIYALYVLSLMLFILPINGLMGNILGATNNQKYDLISVLIGFSFGLILQILLSYKLGFLGTSIANIISYIIIVCFQYYYIIKKIMSINIFQNIKKPLLSVILTVGFTLFFKDMNVFLLSFCAITIYIISLIVLKTFPKNDIKLLVDIFNLKIAKLNRISSEEL